MPLSVASISWRTSSPKRAQAQSGPQKRIFDGTTRLGASPLTEVAGTLTASFTTSGLALGPDLYSYFRDHPTALSADGVHPTDAGAQAINNLWAEWRLNGRNEE